MAKMKFYNTATSQWEVVDAKNADTATKLATARNIALAGDITGNANFDGSTNTSIAVTIANKGTANGLATLGADGKVPTAQLPALGGNQNVFASVKGLASDGTTSRGQADADNTSDVLSLKEGSNIAIAVDSANDVITISNTYSYTHPASHAPSIITQDSSNRFVTDAEKTTWNAKASTAVATTGTNGLMSSTDKSKLDGMAAGANNYTHPTGDGNSHIPATGTTNNGKVLKSGSTANSAAWANVDWTEITNKPTSFTPLTHSHVIADIAGLQTALDGKASTSHTHAYIPTSEKGVANGIATLGSDGKVPATQLPSSSGGGKGYYTYLIAAANARETTKANADYLCTGTDDQITINQAIQTAISSGIGATIRLSEGTFNVSSPIVIDIDNMPSPFWTINLEGSGMNVTILQNTVNCNFMNINATNSRSSFEICDLTMYFQRDGAFKCGISVNNSGDSSRPRIIQRVLFENPMYGVNGFNGILINEGKNIRIKDCKFWNTTLENSNGYAINVDDCDFFAFEPYVMLRNYGVPFAVNNCTFRCEHSFGGYAIYIHNGNTKVTNCLFYNIVPQGDVTLGSSTNIIKSGNLSYGYSGIPD